MAKSKPVNFGFRLEALAWNAYAGGMSALGLERASRVWNGDFERRGLIARHREGRAKRVAAA